MTFLAPIWLTALLPWAALAAWTMFGRRRRQPVPFLALWDAPDEIRRPKKGFEPPPIALILALVALLLAVLAVAQPRVWPRGVTADRGRITIVVDRGESMSALAGGRPRFAEVAQRIGPRLLETLGPGSVDLIDVVTGGIEHTDREVWAGIATRWKRTAVDTTAALQATVRQHVEHGEPTLVITDRDIGFADEQLVQVMPHDPVRNVAIIGLAARPGQVMVTLRSTADAQRTLSIRDRERIAQQQVQLKAGIDQRVFIDVPAVGDVIEGSIDSGDDFDADDRAWLVRRRASPIVEPRMAVGDELRRMIEVYGRHRPAGEGSLRLAVAAVGDLRADEPGVLLAPVDGAPTPRGPVATRAQHPILAGVDWAGVSAGVVIAAKTPGEGWATLATVDEKPIVAVRDGDVRQVWVGFESQSFARTPAFVLLWTNILDWAGAGAEGFFAAHAGPLDVGARRLAPDRLSDDVDGPLWPGLFETAQGKLALNAEPVTFRSNVTEDWIARVSRLRLGPGTGIDLTPWLALAAMSLLVGTAATWERRHIPTSS